jgi:hypothetical protein
MLPVGPSCRSAAPPASSWCSPLAVAATVWNLGRGVLVCRARDVDQGHCWRRHRSTDARTRRHIGRRFDPRPRRSAKFFSLWWDCALRRPERCAQSGLGSSLSKEVFIFRFKLNAPLKRAISPNPTCMSSRDDMCRPGFHADQAPRLCCELRFDLAARA